MTLSAPDFALIQKIVLDRAAISLASDQEYLVRSRLEPLARERGLGDLDALVAELRREPTGVLCSAVVDAMTTNETSFFRDVHPYEALSKTILPDLIERRRHVRALTVWSAACATGQEPYSLAMLLSNVPELAGWRVRIIASDVSKRVLLKGQEGVYSALEVGRGVPARMLATCFDRVGTAFRVKSQLRAMIEWKQMNLAAPWATLPMLDVVFMRNVLIYFPKEAVAAVLKKTATTLHRDGYLVLGTTENMLGVSAGFESSTIGRTMVYRPLGARNERR